jgi:hypothetical protein
LSEQIFRVDKWRLCRGYPKEQEDAICRWVDSEKVLETYDRVDIVPVEKG